jgi:two-component system response regulator NreC
MHSLRVLLVDRSDTFVAAVIRVLLADPHVSLIACACSARAALAEATTLQPDVILVEVSLADMSGFDLARQIKALANAPLVFLLALHDIPEYRTAAAAAGANEFIGKEDFSVTWHPLLSGAIAPLRRRQWRRAYET